jgi:2-polyprenyl-6-methoxyphenol hydroxylase-like FAD-dependent oxidoreductase
MKSHGIPVLIVGAGSAGLTTAVALARYDVERLLVERRLTPSLHPRATVIGTRTMEYLRAWGAGGSGARRRRRGRDWLMWHSETLARAADGFGVEVGLPTRAQDGLVRPTAPACMPQDHLQSVLRADLRSLERATVEVGTELARLDGRTDGVRVTLRAGTGETRDVRARYLVAADGAHSAVRAAGRRRVRAQPCKRDRALRLARFALSQMAVPAGRHTSSLTWIPASALRPAPTPTPRDVEVAGERQHVPTQSDREGDG